MLGSQGGTPLPPSPGEPKPKLPPRPPQGPKPASGTGGVYRSGPGRLLASGG